MGRVGEGWPGEEGGLWEGQGRKGETRLPGAMGFGGCSGGEKDVEGNLAWVLCRASSPLRDPGEIWEYRPALLCKACVGVLAFRRDVTRCQGCLHSLPGGV